MHGPYTHAPPLMAFEDLCRLSAHAVITDEAGRVLLLKATYGALSWGLPGGALEPGETMHLGAVQRQRVDDCLQFAGDVRSRRF